MIDVVDVVFVIFVYYVEFFMMGDLLDCIIDVVECCVGMYCVNVGVYCFVGCCDELLCEFVWFVDEVYVVCIVELVVFDYCDVEVYDVVVVYWL